MITAEEWENLNILALLDPIELHTFNEILEALKELDRLKKIIITIKEALETKN